MDEKKISFEEIMTRIGQTDKKEVVEKEKEQLRPKIKKKKIDSNKK